MRRSVLYILILSTCVAVTASAGPRTSQPVVVPPWAVPYGQTYGEWAVDWWQWALAQPADENPILLPDDSTQTTEQTGKVWFLAGTVGNDEGPIIRHITVPPGKALFFPVINIVWVTLEFVGDERFSVPGAEAWARSGIAMDPLAELEVTVNGTPLGLTSYQVPGGDETDVVKDLTAFRAISPVFTVWLPEDNYFDALYGEWFDTPGGEYPDCVADGYWIMLDRLPRGETIIEFKGVDTREGGATVEVTYIVTVGRKAQASRDSGHARGERGKDTTLLK